MLLFAVVAASLFLGGAFLFNRLVRTAQQPMHLPLGRDAAGPSVVRLHRHR